jgi:hypothetical protein
MSPAVALEMRLVRRTTGSAGRECTVLFDLSRLHKGIDLPETEPSFGKRPRIPPHVSRAAPMRISPVLVLRFQTSGSRPGRSCDGS